jgi:hypothetical protein
MDKNTKTKPADPARVVGSTLGAVAVIRHRALSTRKILQMAVWLVAGIAVALVVDWFAVWQSPVGRWAGLGLVGLLGGSLAWRIRMFFRRGPDRAAAARALDQLQKNSGDRWVTFASLQTDGAKATGSDGMVKALIEEMAPLCQYVNPATVEPLPSSRRVLISLAGLAFFITSFLAIFYSQGSPRLLARFLLPWARLPLTQVELTSDLPQALLKGSNLEIAALVKGKRPAAVWLEIDDGRILPASGENHRFTIENLQNSFRYRVAGGDATTEWQSVLITTRPRLGEVAFTITEPPYSKRPPQVWSHLPELIRVIQGSKLSLRFNSDLPLEKADLEVASHIKRTIPLELAEGCYRYQRELTSDFIFRPVFTSQAGFANLDLPFTTISVVADQPPSVKLTEESGTETLSSQHGLEVAFTARDDIGLAAAEVVFSITNPQGETRTGSRPINLGDRAGQAVIDLKTKVLLDQLDLGPNDKISYAVRVQDNFLQKSSSESDPASDATSPGSPESEMTKRSLKIGGASAQSESQPLKVASTEMINQIAAKEKKMLSIETAFQQLKVFTASALNQSRGAAAPAAAPGAVVDTSPLHSAVAAARGDIKSAVQSVEEIKNAAPGTPYAFLNIQLQSIIRSNLSEADLKLEGSIKSRLPELPPREMLRQQAEGQLRQALARLASLEGTIFQVRSQVKAGFAMTELMTSYVAQIEDLPTLLGEEEAGTPYQRSPGEVDRAQAEAALRKLESKKELFKKTAELLQQNPELWRRYLDKSKTESKIFRDELESLAHRHQIVKTLTGRIKSGGAAELQTLSLIAAHQKQINSDLLRTLEKAQTWHLQEGLDKPAWLSELETLTYGALKQSVDAAAAGQITDFNQKLDLTIRELGEPASGAAALRFSELNRIRSESGLVAALETALGQKAWREAALLEQANIAHCTQQLAGKIEAEGVNLNSLGPEVADLGNTLNKLMEQTLLPPLLRSVMKLQDTAGPVEVALTAQAEAVEGYAQCLSVLDQFVNAAIRELDKTPAQASGGGGPRITANTLEELQRQLARENEISESFGIPCCRPINFQVMSDWDRVSRSSGRSPSPVPSPASQSSENQGTSEKPTAPDSTGYSPRSNRVQSATQQGTVPPLADQSAQSSQEKSTRSTLSMAQLAQEASRQQAESLAAMISSDGSKGEPASTPGQGSGNQPSPGNFETSDYNQPLSTTGKNWNRLNSTLRPEILQEKTAHLPEEYREAIESYFRSLSKYDAAKE